MMQPIWTHDDLMMIYNALNCLYSVSDVDMEFLAEDGAEEALAHMRALIRWIAPMIGLEGIEP